MKKYWFKPKKYGYGFSPISIEEWIFTIIFILVLIFSAYTNNFFSPKIENKDGMRFLFDILVLSIIFMLLVKDKIDGKLKWRWGKIKR